MLGYRIEGIDFPESLALPEDAEDQRGAAIPLSLKRLESTNYNYDSRRKRWTDHFIEVSKLADSWLCIDRNTMRIMVNKPVHELLAFMESIEAYVNTANMLFTNEIEEEQCAQEDKKAKHKAYVEEAVRIDKMIRERYAATDVNAEEGEKNI